MQGEQGEKAHDRKDINYEKKESKRYTYAIQLDAEKVYSDASVLMEEAKEKKRQVHDNIHFYPME